jgi:hypothetical protein
LVTVSVTVTVAALPVEGVIVTVAV